VNPWRSKVLKAAKAKSRIRDRISYTWVAPVVALGSTLGRGMDLRMLLMLLVMVAKGIRLMLLVMVAKEV